jgi:hypothetical protein
MAIPKHFAQWQQSNCRQNKKPKVIVRFERRSAEVSRFALFKPWGSTLNAILKVRSLPFHVGNKGSKPLTLDFLMLVVFGLNFRQHLTSFTLTPILLQYHWSGVFAVHRNPSEHSSLRPLQQLVANICRYVVKIHLSNNFEGLAHMCTAAEVGK